MPKNPHPPHGEPEFGWLYGPDGAPLPAHEYATPADGGGSETRVMPAIPGAPVEPTRPRRPRRTRVRWRRIVVILALLWLIFLVLVPILSWQRITRVDMTPNGNRPSFGSGTNYLLVGSDTRKGLTTDQQNALGVGGVSVDTGRTDTIMILHTGNGPAVLISVPRDSLVKVPGHGTDKINAAYYFGGPKLLTQTIEQDTGLRIDHFVEVGLGGFVQAVDAVGGVQICPTEAVKDPLANLDVKPGCQIADGVTALGWARSRHAFALGDVARAQHQREILKQVADRAESPLTFVLPWRYLAINNAGANTLTVDNDMSMFAILGFVRGMSSISSGGKTCTMPISDLAVHWDTTRFRELIQHLRDDSTNDIPANVCTVSGLPS